MADNIQGYSLKVKGADGTWFDVPVLYTSIYDAYCTYCAEQTPPLIPVTADIYYGTLGTLSALVESLGDNTASIQELTTALAGGNLPLSKGGLGVSIDPNSTTDYLKSLKAFILYTANLNEKTATTAEINSTVTAKFASGTLTPANAGLAPTVEYYFQYE